MSAHNCEIISAFHDAIVQAQMRIWMMDPHFDEQFGLATIWTSLCMTGAKDLRVISHENKPDDWIKKQEIGGCKLPACLQWRGGFHELHDRFAIIDDEMWHFGSSVGGGYPGFGAASSGWDAAHISRVFLAKWGHR